MKREAKIGYHTHKQQEAQQWVTRHANRLKWLEREENDLWPEEVKELLKFHQEGYKDSLRRWEEAETWLENYSRPPMDKDKATFKVERLSDILLGESLPIEIRDASMVIVPRNKKVTKPMLALVVEAFHNETLNIEPSSILSKIWEVLSKS